MHIKKIRYATLKVGLGMNNCVRLSQHQKDGDLRVTICNNDQTISVYSIPNMQKLVLLEMPAAINQGKKRKKKNYITITT